MHSVNLLNKMEVHHRGKWIFWRQSVLGEKLSWGNETYLQ